MNEEELPEIIIYECAICDDYTEHEILKGRFGKASVSGTFKCIDCGTVEATTIRLPEELPVKVLYSDGDETIVTQTILMSNEVIEIGDEFFLDTGERVRVTKIEVTSGRTTKRIPAPRIKSLWVKQFGVINVKFSINDNHRTIAKMIEAEPEDTFTVGMMVPFEDFDCYVHAIKTKARLIRHGSAEAKEITRIYGKIRKKQYAVMDFDDDE
ncbi:MAG TPA: HVO_0476 family zinc finger protein [Candidatus Methanomethylophilaceae archaeon]|nr:HVO_0476 family zinc finger protein [Candidatus Methanomethylophilaceae archaeon]